MDWQSLAVLFGIISELLNVVRCSALRCSHELTLKKLVALQIMKGITSAHSKCFIFHFGFWYSFSVTFLSTVSRLVCPARFNWNYWNMPEYGANYHLWKWWNFLCSPLLLAHTAHKHKMVPHLRLHTLWRISPLAEHLFAIFCMAFLSETLWCLGTSFCLKKLCINQSDSSC